MTTFYLVRHGTTDAVGSRLAGRQPNVHLNSEGRAESEQLAARLGSLPLRRLFSSPLERARETLAPLAARTGLDVEILPGIQEFDFGAWTGRSFDELREVPNWHRFNSFRSGARAPGGEHLGEVQLRAIHAMEEVREQVSDGLVLLVSHADVIRAILAYYAAIPLDLFLRLEISPASVSVLRLTQFGPQLLATNITERLPI